jgi:nitrogen fixation/metabolism regulation signal transduction histidine kinase
VANASYNPQSEIRIPQSKQSLDMFSRYRSRIQLALAFFGGIFLFALLCVLALTLLTPAAPTARAPILLSIFILTFVCILLSGILLLRWLLRPYYQLVNEAQRAPVAAQPGKARNEAEFVLQTFQSIVAQLQDQQRELEQLNAQASERAVSAEQFSERIVASVPSGLVAFDASGRATVVNAPARALIEASGEALGQQAEIIFRNAPGLAEMVRNCLRHGEVYRREEVSATSVDGHTRRLGATIAPIDPSPTRAARGALCLLTDITEVMQLREQVALKRNLESLGEMSAGLAHEFKNALATLHGYAQLLQNQQKDAGGSAAANAMLLEVRNLSEMVTAFLNFARPRPLDLADVSLRELVQECAGELRAFVAEHRVSLSIEGDFPSIRADERMLRQALLNLLRNAAEAMAQGQDERRVVIKGARLKSDASGHDWTSIQIRDTGQGIPPADLQRIFIPFFTTKSEGHGVGLALAHRVVTDHGGTLTASNAPQGGAIFMIKLPVG